MIAGLSLCVDVVVDVKGTCGMQGRSLRQFFFCFHRLWFVCRDSLRSCVNAGTVQAISVRPGSTVMKCMCNVNWCVPNVLAYMHRIG